MLTKSIAMHFIATVEEKHIPHIQEIADKLSKMGNQIIHVGKFTGVITGSTGNNQLSDLKISGIKSVEPDRNISIH